MTHRKIPAALMLLSAMFIVSAPAKSKKAKSTDQTTHAASSKAMPGAKVDINSASQKDLDALPGVGPATAKKIVAGRPYSSVADLSRAGLKPAIIQQITPMITVGPAAANIAPAPQAKAAAAAQGRAPAQVTPAPMTPAPAPRPAPQTRSAAPQGSPGPGMVWVNTETKVYHHQGDRWYGNTKAGRYMTESDALKAGYRDSKQDAATKKK